MIEDLEKVQKEKSICPGWYIGLTAFAIVFLVLFVNWPNETIASIILLAIPVLVFLGFKALRDILR